MKASYHGNHYQQKLKTSPFGPHNENLVATLLKPLKM
jgi:hypothetical protein